MKHHCSTRNLSAQLAKLTGNICITGNPRRLKQMLKDVGRREHLATSTSLGHSQAAGGASVTWRSLKRRHGAYSGTRQEELRTTSSKTCCGSSARPGHQKHSYRVTPYTTTDVDQK